MVLGFGSNVVTIVIQAKDRFSKSINKAKRSLGDFRAAAIAAGAAGAIIAVGLVKATKAAVDAQETFSKFSVVFDEVSRDAEKVAQDFAKNFGLASSTAKELLGNTGDLLSGFGFTDEAALSLSKRTNELAADLASFTNIQGGTERASRALTKALLGERESVKELGIAILESDVQGRLKEKGLDKLTGASLKQAKAEVTLELAIEQSKNAIGDFNRTQDQAANQLKITQERFKTLQEEIGLAFIPVLEAVLPLVQGMLQFFIDLPGPMKTFLVILAVTTAAIGLLAGAIALLTLVSSPWLLIIGAIILALTAITFAVIQVVKHFDELKIKVAETWNSIIRSTEKGVNFFIRGINKIIEARNKFNIIKIPKISEVSFAGALIDIGNLTKVKDAQKDITDQAIKQTAELKKRVELVESLKGFRVLPSGDIFDPSKPFKRSEFKNREAFEQANLGIQKGFSKLTIINIDNVQGLDPDEVAEALQNKLKTEGL